MATMTQDQKKKVTDQMASRFFAPVSKPAPGPPRERAAARTASAPGRTPAPEINKLIDSLLAAPVISRDRNLTDAQNAQLSRDSIIRTARQNQELAGKLLERDMANRGSYDVQRLSNVGGLEQQQLRNQGDIQATRMREEGATGRTAMSEEGATGRVQLQEKGLADRLLKGHQLGIEELGEQNKYNRETANRELVKTLLAGGAQGDTRMNQLYNQGGAFNADLEGLAVPKETADYGFTKLTGGVDEQGRLLPDQLIRTNKRTGEAQYTDPGLDQMLDQMLGGAGINAEQSAPAENTRQPGGLEQGFRNTSYSGKVAGALADRITGGKGAGTTAGPGAQQQQAVTEQDVLFAENTLGKDFDPFNANPEQKQYLRNLMSVNRPLFDYLMSKHSAGRAD